MESKRILLTVSYDGTAYAGWQFQSNGPSIQEEVEKALAELKCFAADHGRSVSEIALAWLLGKKAVTTVIAGARSVDQVRQNVRALDAALTAEEMAELDRLSDGIKQKLGANMDPWRNAGGPLEPRIC